MKRYQWLLGGAVMLACLLQTSGQPPIIASAPDHDSTAPARTSTPPLLPQGRRGAGGEDARRSFPLTNAAALLNPTKHSAAVELPRGAPASAPSASPLIPGQPPENLILTGLAHIGSLKCAFLQVEQTGQPIRYYTLKEGEQKGAFQLLAVDAARSQITLRHHGLLQQLKLRHARPTPLDAERHKDLSHSQHHTLRARLEREQDERAAVTNSEALPDPVKDEIK